MSGLRRLSGVDELRALAPDDLYVRTQTGSPRISSTWAGADGSLAWVLPSRRAPGRGHVVVLGPADAGARLLLGVLDEVGDDVGSVSVPQGAAALLRPTYELERAHDWEWYVATQAPPVQPGEELVGWLDDSCAEEITRLLRTHSGRHDAEPGDREVRRWCGVRDASGSLVAVAAHTEYHRGVPFLASVATRTDARGRGLGAAVTAWITRRLLEEGSPVVTLGMYSDNAVARRIYLRLGFTCAHAFTSGRLVPHPPAPPAERKATDDPSE